MRISPIVLLPIAALAVAGCVGPVEVCLLAEPPGVAIRPDTTVIVGLRDDLPVSARVSPETCEDRPDRSVEWSSSHPAVVSIQARGDTSAVARGESPGAAYVRATSRAAPHLRDSVLVRVYHADPVPAGTRSAPAR